MEAEPSVTPPMTGAREGARITPEQRLAIMQAMVSAGSTWAETVFAAIEPLLNAALADAVAAERKALDAIYQAAKVDNPDEGKHELAVRIMRLCTLAHAR